eukprot:1015898-Pelagomonas_calceolata.AAC.2
MLPHIWYEFSEMICSLLRSDLVSRSSSAWEGPQQEMCIGAEYEKEKESVPAKRQRTSRKRSLASKLARVSTKGPQT